MNLKKASFINAIGKFSTILLNLVVNAILARILTPDDYGVVAVITVFSTFFATFSDMGFGAAIIQKKDLTQSDINNIFSFTGYVAVILAILFLLLSYPISLFYKNDAYITLGAMLSISLLFSALNMVPNGIINRDKRFVLIAVRTVVVYLSASAITIGLAYAGLRYYALAIQAILTSLFTFLWNLLLTRPKFRLYFQMNSIQKVLNYSGFQFAFNIVNYFSRNLDNLLTGKFFGDDQLGYYNKAYTLMLYPVNNLTGVISPVLHPVLSDYQAELKTIYTKYMKIVRLLALMGLFIAPVCFLASKEIICILYGDNWMQTIDCFRLLSLAIIPQMINSSAGAIFQATNNTKLLFINSCINTAITVAAILMGIFAGGNIVVLSACVAVAYNIHFLTAFYMLIRFTFGFQIKAFAKDLLPELMILAIMIVGVLLYPFHVGNIVLSALVKGVWMLLFYCAGLVVSKEYKLLLQLIGK